MRLLGTQVLEVLERAVTNVFSDDPKLKVGGMIQISGIRFQYDLERAIGQRIVMVELLVGEWELEKHYRIATNSMLAEGGHNQHTFLQGQDVEKHGSQFEAIKLWFIQNSPIRAPRSGRITRVRI